MRAKRIQSDSMARQLKQERIITELLRRMENEGEIAALPPPGPPLGNTEIPLEPLTRVPRPSVILQSRPPTPPPPTQPTRKGKEPVSTAQRTPG